MKYVILSLLLLLTLIIQTVWFPAIHLFAAFPDILLVLVVSVALLDGLHLGMGLGFVTGLLTDVLFMASTGWGVIFYMSAALFAGSLRQRIRSEQVLIPALMCMGAILIRELITILIIWMRGLPLAFPLSLVTRTLPIMLYTGAAAIAGYFLLYHLYRRPVMRR